VQSKAKLEGSMKRTADVFAGAIFVGLATLGLVGCSDSVPTPTYGQSRAIDQDIDATHAGTPSLATPTASDADHEPTPPMAWRNEESIDRQKAEQSGQLPQ
jgi:hypothetical protein